MPPQESETLSDHVQAIRDQLRADLTTRLAEHGTMFSLELTEADALDLASGYVPTAVKAAILAMLDWTREDERRAARPTRVPPGGSGAGARKARERGLGGP